MVLWIFNLFFFVRGYDGLTVCLTLVADIAQFLHKGEGLNKTAIGDYLGERNDFNQSVLDAFVCLHDFTDLILVQALRFVSPPLPPSLPCPPRSSRREVKAGGRLCSDKGNR